MNLLYKYTKDDFYSQLLDRTMQNYFFTQVTEGEYKGAAYETICDPWLERGQGFESMKSPYFGEQNLESILQLVEMGLVK